MDVENRGPLVSNDPLDGVVLYKEYRLIKKKLSKLSASRRAMVVEKYERYLAERKEKNESRKG